MMTRTWRTAGSNVHLLRGHRDVLVDPGPPGSGPAVRRRLRRLGVTPDGLGAVLLTHGHVDHAGAAREVAGDAPILLGRGDAAMAVGILPEFVDHVRHLDDVGVEGEMVVVGGHTSGSCVVVTPCTLVVGDLVRGAGLAGWTGLRAPSPGRSADPLRDLRAVRRLLDEHQPRRVLVGHGACLDGPTASRRVDELLRRMEAAHDAGGGAPSPRGRAGAAASAMMDP